MTTLDALLAGVRAAPRARPAWAAPGILLPAAVVLLLAVAVVAPGALSPADPEHADTAAILRPPSAAHPFGTDQLGRDVLSRVIHGAGYSLTIGLGATALALVVGSVVGLLAGLGPRGIDRAVSRVVDVLLAFPDLLLALLVISVLGRGPVNTLVAVGLSSVASYARLVRAQVRQARLSGFAEHARTLGEHPLRIVVGHILPNAVRPLVVVATIGVGSAILNASALSFLGLGVAPPTPEWGAILSEARSYLDIAPWAAILPATVVAASVVSITVLGRRLQAFLANGAGA